MVTKLEVARAFIKKKGPYFTAMTYSLIPRPRPGYGTVSTSKNLIMVYDPDWFEALSTEKAAGALVHEGMHVFRKHFERSEGFPDKRRYNVAGDLSINPDLREMGWELPDGALFPKYYGFPEFLGAEEYYHLLEKLESKQEKEQKKQQKKGSGKGDPQPGPGQPGQGPPQPGQGPAQPPKDPHGNGACAGGCGGAAGNPRPEEQEEEDAVRQEEPEALKSDVDIQAIVKQTAKEMSDFVSQGRGTLPRHLVELANAALAPPKVKWRQVLPRLIRRATGKMEAGGQDFSKRRPSKRSFMRGMLVPGMISNEPEIVMIRDTSGSMGKKQLQDAQNEAVGVMRQMGIDEVWFMDADAAAGKPKRVRVRDIPKLPITGRGGTDFGPAIERAAKLNPRPNVILYFTDGDGPTPDFPPRGVEVVWVIVKSYWNKKPCDWGHCVFVDD